MSGDDNPRRIRVASSMRQLLADLLQREVKDPRVRAVGFIGVNHVELNRDMSVARVYVSFLGGDLDATDLSHPTIVDAMAGLRAAAGFLRGPMARQLGLRHAPSLRFVADDSPAFQKRLHDLARADASARVDGDATGDDPDGDATGDDPDGDATGDDPDGVATGDDPDGVATGDDPDGVADRGGRDDDGIEQP